MWAYFDWPMTSATPFRLCSSRCSDSRERADKRRRKGGEAFRLSRSPAIAFRSTRSQATVLTRPLRRCRAAQSPLQNAVDQIVAMIAVRPALAYQRPMSPLTETVLFVFGLVALGYCAGWSGYLKAETGDGLVGIRRRRRHAAAAVPHHGQRRFPWRRAMAAVGGLFRGGRSSPGRQEAWSRRGCSAATARPASSAAWRPPSPTRCCSAFPSCSACSGRTASTSCR